eukprot:38843-Alexandrium_andersonii.AAC.1
MSVTEDDIEIPQHPQTPQPQSAQQLAVADVLRVVSAAVGPEAQRTLDQFQGWKVVKSRKTRMGATRSRSSGV